MTQSQQRLIMNHKSSFLSQNSGRQRRRRTMIVSTFVIATLFVGVVKTAPNVVGFVSFVSQMRTQQQPIVRQHSTKIPHYSSRNYSLISSVLCVEKSSVNGEESLATPDRSDPTASASIRNEQQQPTSMTSYSNGSNGPSIATGVATSSKPFVKKKLQTFLRYLEVECWKRSDLRGLEPVLQAVASACKQITRIVQRAQTDDVYGVALDVDGNPLSDTNVQGEVQQKLDVLCNTIMLQAFCGSGRDIHAVASEEEDEPRCCSDVMDDSAFAMGDFVAVFDPIDGSKNIDASLPVGTIFGIYKRLPNNDAVSTESFLQDGHNLVSAGYCLYSATTVLVLTLGSGVDGFTLDPDTGRFIHTHKDIRIPAAGPIYSFNEAHFNDYEEPVQRYLEALKSGSSSVGVRSNARYIGALVADVHNVLINGGIYGYPKTKSSPNGKLRLLYESAPMAMIIEQAGGAGSTGHGRILDVKPTKIHQRVPTFLGSTENVFELDQFYRYYGDDTTV